MFILYKLLFLIFLSSIQALKDNEVWNHFLNTSAIKPSASKLVPVECEHITNKKTRFCRYRDDGLFPLDIWNWKAGHGCYWYLRPSWFKKRINDDYFQILTYDGYNYKMPFGKTHDGQSVLFDYKDLKYVKLIQESFAGEEYFSKWKDCAEAADACCQLSMDNNNICPTEAFPCPAIWDAWSCFFPARKDSNTNVPCPEYISSSSNAPCLLSGEKECFSNGTWNQSTNYGPCSEAASVYRGRHSFHVIVLYVSISLSFPAVLVFVAFKKLRVLRVNLHRNLLIVCILRNILTIMSKEIVILDSLRTDGKTNDVLINNGVPCRILAYFTSVANNAIYACMLMDGFYLHKLIVRIFSDDPNVNIMYVITAILSILPTTIWAILMAIEADESCWMADGSWFQWIPDGFRIAILAINIILLLDIIRALLSKLRKNVSAQHTKYSYILINNGMSYDSILRRAYTSTLKAMGFLIPLFGVPFIITANRNIVDMDSCTAGDIYYYVSYSIQALQGIMVALLFCYANKEVHTQIKGAFQNLQRQYQTKFGSKNVPKPPNRRETAATYVHNNSPVSKHNDDPVQDTSERVQDWLTDRNVLENQEISASDSNKNGEKMNNSKTDYIQEGETDNDKKVYFDRISKFIDDSFESLNNFDNQQQLKVNPK